jgi:hypothetical protein
MKKKGKEKKILKKEDLQNEAIDERVVNMTK